MNSRIKTNNILFSGKTTLKWYHKRIQVKLKQHTENIKKMLILQKWKCKRATWAKL